MNTDGIGMPPDFNLNKTKCTECAGYFRNLYNLRRHLKKFHPNKVDEVAPLYYKNKSNFTHSCDQCGKNFTYRQHLISHTKTHNTTSIVEQGNSQNTENKRYSKKCPLCPFYCSKKKDILSHFEKVHEITVLCKDFNFSCLNDFNQWLSNVESETLSKYVNKGTKTLRTHTTTSYVCHRSGFYVAGGKGLRNLKINGSLKIDGYCPASIKLIKSNEGKCQIQFIESHVGHSSETNLGYLYLTKEERRNLAMKIASKIPLDDILDDVRNSIPNLELKRIHLLKRKDLYNIEKSFNLSSNSVRHANDAISVDVWVKEMKRDNGCVIFYKPQGTVLEEHPELKFEDFVLIIMTSAQSELLKKYGSDCICVDGTHGLNNNNFELHTLLVLDDLGEGFPCSFLISNRSDTQVLKLFFLHIKEQAGLISPKIFMSDLADTYFNAWLEVMNPPEKRLFCTWHLDRAWRKNLTKIKAKEKQITIYKHLRTLLQERDAVAFVRMVNQFCEVTCNDSETKDFGKYFKDNYMTNYQFWAYSFRLHSGINTNMHLERMHKSIEYIYLKGKHVKRLDKGISAIMRFVRDKLIDRLIVINKGKLCSKIKDIRSRHRTSLKLDSNLIIKSECGWEVRSEKNREIYLIQELNQGCACQLICGECNICIHSYCCSCIDSSIRYNICKHIHLLANFRRGEHSDEQQHTIDVEDNECNNLDIHCNNQNHPNINESDAIVQQLSKNKIAVSLEEEKEKLKKRILSHLDEIHSSTELELVKKVLAPLFPTLTAAKNQDIKFPTNSDQQPNNKNIEVQRRLRSRKKKLGKAKIQ